MTPAVGHRLKPPSTAPRAVIAAEARLRATTPVAQVRRRSTSAVAVTPALQHRTQTWLATLTPQQRALIPKDVHYGRVEVPIEVEPGDDPLLLEEPGVKRRRRELERRRSTVKKRRVSKGMPKPRESAAADDTFANQVQRRVARQARTAASSQLRNSVVREASAEAPEMQEDEEAPPNFDSPFVPRTLGHLAGLARGSPSTPPSDDEDEAEGVDFDDGFDFPPDLPSDSGSERELTPGPAERYGSLSHLSPSPTPRTSFGEHATYSSPHRRLLEEEEQTILASEGTRMAVAEALGARMAEDIEDEDDEGMAELEEELAAELNSPDAHEDDQPEEPGPDDVVQPEEAEEVEPEDEQPVDEARPSPSPSPAEGELNLVETYRSPPANDVHPEHRGSPELEEDEANAEPDVHRRPSTVEYAVEEEPVSPPSLSPHHSPAVSDIRRSSSAEEAVEEPVHEASSLPLSPRSSPEESLDDIDPGGDTVIVETAEIDVEVQVAVEEEELDFEGDTGEEPEPEGISFEEVASHRLFSPVDALFGHEPSSAPSLPRYPPRADTGEEEIEPEGEAMDEDIDPEGDTFLADESEDALLPTAHQFTSPRLSAVPEEDLDLERSTEDIDPEGDTREEVNPDNTNSGEDLDPEGDTMEDLDPEMRGEPSSPLVFPVSQPPLPPASSSPVEGLDASASTEEDEGEEPHKAQDEGEREGSLHDVVAAYNRALGVPSDGLSSPSQARAQAQPSPPTDERTARQARIQQRVLYGAASPLSPTTTQPPEPEVDLDMPASRRRRKLAGSTPAKPRLSGSLEDIKPPSPGPRHVHPSTSPQASPDVPPQHAHSLIQQSPGSSPQASPDAPPPHARSSMQPPVSPLKAPSLATGPPIPTSLLRSPAARGFPSVRSQSLSASPDISSPQPKGKGGAEPSPTRSQHSPARVLLYGDDDARRHFEDRPTPERSFASSSRAATPISRASTPGRTSPVAKSSHTSQTPGIEVLSLRARTPRSLTRGRSESRLQASPLAGPSTHTSVHIRTAELHVSLEKVGPSPQRPSPRRPSPPEPQHRDTTRDADPSAWDEPMDAEGPTLDGASDVWGDDTMDITQEMDDSMGGYRYDGAEWDVTRIERVRERSERIRFEARDRAPSDEAEDEDADEPTDVLRPPALRVTPAPEEEEERTPMLRVPPAPDVEDESVSVAGELTPRASGRVATHLTPTQVQQRSPVSPVDRTPARLSPSAHLTPRQHVPPRSPSAHLTPTLPERSPGPRGSSAKSLTPRPQAHPRSPSAHLTATEQQAPGPQHASIEQHFTPTQQGRSPSQHASSTASARQRQGPRSPNVVHLTPSRHAASERLTPILVQTPTMERVTSQQQTRSPFSGAQRTLAQPSPRPRSRASSIARNPPPRHSVSVEDIEDEDAPRPTPRRQRSRTPSVSEALQSPRRSPRLSHTSSLADEPTPSPRRSLRLSRSPSVAFEVPVPVPVQSPRRSARLSRASTPVAESAQPSPSRSPKPSSAIREPTFSQRAQPSPHPIQTNVSEDTWPRLDPARQKWAHEVDAKPPQTALEPAELPRVTLQPVQQLVQRPPPVPVAGPSQRRRRHERYPIPEHCIEEGMVNFVVHERVIDVTLVKDESDWEEDGEEEPDVIHFGDSRDDGLGDEGIGEEHLPEEEFPPMPMDGSEGMAYEEEEDSRMVYAEEDNSRLNDSLENDPHMDDSLENNDSRMEYDDSLEDNSNSRMEYDECDELQVVPIHPDEHCGLVDGSRPGGDEAEVDEDEASAAPLSTNEVPRASTPRPASSHPSPVQRTPVVPSRELRLPGSRSSAPSPATPGRTRATSEAQTPSGQARTASGPGRTSGPGPTPSGHQRTPSAQERTPTSQGRTPSIRSPAVTFNLQPQLSLGTGGSEPSRNTGLEGLGLLGATTTALDAFRQIGTPQTTRAMLSTTPQVPPPASRPGSNISVSSTPLQPPPAFRGQSTTPIIHQGPQIHRPVTTTPAAPPPHLRYSAQGTAQPAQTKTQERNRTFGVPDAGPGPSSQRTSDTPTSHFVSQRHLGAESQHRPSPVEPPRNEPRREPQRNQLLHDHQRTQPHHAPQLLHESQRSLPRYAPETYRPARPSALSRQVLPSAESTPESRRSLRESRSLPEGTPRTLHDELEHSRRSHLERNQRNQASPSVQTVRVEAESYDEIAQHTPRRSDTSHFDSPAPPVPGGWTRTPLTLPRSPRRVARGPRTWTTADWRRLENFYDAERSRAATWTPFTRSRQWSVARVVDNFITRMQLQERELVGEWSRDDLEIRVRALDNAADYRERARSIRRSQRSATQDQPPPSTLRRVVDWALGRSTSSSAPAQAPQPATRRRERTDPELGFLRRVDESFDPDVTMAATPSQLPRPRSRAPRDPDSSHRRPRTRMPDSSYEQANTSEEYEREQPAEHRRLQPEASARERLSRSPRQRHHPRDLANIDRAVSEHRHGSAYDNTYPDTTYDYRSPSPQPTEIEDESYRYNAASPRLYNLYPPIPDRSAALAQSVRPTVIESSPRPVARQRSATLPSASPLSALRQSTHVRPTVSAAASAFTAHASADLSYESARRARERENVAGLRRVRSEVGRLRAAGHDISDESFESFRAFNEELNASVRALGRSLSGRSGGSGAGQNVSGSRGGRNVPGSSGAGAREER